MQARCSFIIQPTLKAVSSSDRVISSMTVYYWAPLRCSAQENFRVYVLLPLLPAFEGEIGTSTGTAIQAVIHWNYSSICRGGKSLLERLVLAGGELCLRLTLAQCHYIVVCYPMYVACRFEQSFPLLSSNVTLKLWLSQLWLSLPHSKQHLSNDDDIRRIRRKIIRTVVCCTAYDSCA